MKQPKIVHNWDELPMVLTVDLVAIIMDCCTTHVCMRCRDGTLPATKVGQSWYIDRDKLREMLGQGNPTPAAPQLTADQTEAIARRVVELIIPLLKTAVNT